MDPDYKFSCFDFTPGPRGHEDLGMEELFRWKNEICDESENYTDEELAEKLAEVRHYCSGANPTNSFFFLTHSRTEKMLRKRAKKYCKKHKIKLKDYKGVLPWQLYIDSFKPEEDVKNSHI